MESINLTPSRHIGQVPWTNEDIKAVFDEFMSVYPQRPIPDNNGGMKIPHLLPMWFFLKHTQPKVIIESGIYKGQGTYFFEKASPRSRIFSIDIFPHNITYRSPNVIYLYDDITTYDWPKLFALHGLENVAPEDMLVFFDDHQDIVRRLQWMKAKTSFKKIIYEDNYPLNEGDCYSFKKALESAQDYPYLESILKTYYEFPPVYVSEFTRWKTPWANYPTPQPLFPGLPTDPLMLEEMKDYTWICYAELK